ncbi:MAG TPA: NepR family anti-sigma factor [Roseiarcus sp.]
MVERDSLEAQMKSAGSGESPGRKVGAETDEGDFPDVHLSEAVQETIGRSLKAYYDDFAKEPIPDRFLVLLAQLEAQELKGGGRDK